MTNGHRAAKLFESAARYRSLMEKAFAEAWWNVAVREAHEVVEPSLRATVLEIFDGLAGKRLPAFYEEVEETEANATRAVEGARRIHALCLRIIARPAE